jgi:hypothetical protein
MTPAAVTLATLVSGGNASAREAAIATHIDPALRTAIILEGLPDGHNALELPSAQAHLKIARIAPGCMCCVGNLVMRVTLNRMLHDKPERLFIGVASSEHIEQLRLFLTQAPYDTLLSLSDDLVCRNSTA